MDTRKNTLLLFAKLPEPGMAKTRLSVLKDGIFSPEDASDLFGCMLLDVVETTLTAFSKMAQEGAGAGTGASASASQQADTDACAANAYELVVSTAPAKNTDAMRRFLEAEFGPLDGRPFPIKVISDAGASFDAHYNDAFSQVWEMGADCILSMGADMPALTADDVIGGFNKLADLRRRNRAGIVLSADQAMGVSIVGWNRETTFDHTGVYYNPTGLTVLPAYIDKARAAGIDAVWLPPVPDVDTIADLAHSLTLMDALTYCAECTDASSEGSLCRPEPRPHRTMAKLDELGCSMVRVPPNELRDPRDVIDG